jgi:hypothetical protein
MPIRRYRHRKRGKGSCHSGMCHSEPYDPVTDPIRIEEDETLAKINKADQLLHTFTTGGVLPDSLLNLRHLYETILGHANARIVELDAQAYFGVHYSYDHLKGLYIHLKNRARSCLTRINARLAEMRREPTLSHEHSHSVGMAFGHHNMI